MIIVLSAHTCFNFENFFWRWHKQTHPSFPSHPLRMDFPLVIHIRTCTKKRFWDDLPSSWCGRSASVSCWLSWKSSTRRARVGAIRTHIANDTGSSVSPMMPPTPFTSVLCCSFAWSIRWRGNLFIVQVIDQLPFPLKLYEYRRWQDSRSLMKIGNHLA